jgi:GNAT superfamily N-acetyltransferase
MNYLREETLAMLETYRWHRALGQKTRAIDHARIIADPAHPNVWDTNHADCITAGSQQQIAEVLQALDQHLSHSDWRIVYTDPQTPESFTAHLALAGFSEKSATIQMALRTRLLPKPTPDLHPVETDADWAALADLVAEDHREGLRTGGASRLQVMTDGIVAGYRARIPSCQFYLSFQDGRPVAYGSYALGPSGGGIIEDLFTLPEARRRGIASGMIAACADRLSGEGCSTIFLGALVGQRAAALYSKLGFVPAFLTRVWARAEPVMR